MDNSSAIVEVRDELRQVNHWLKILATPLVSEKLRSVLKRDDEWRVYQASDGSAREQVAKAASVSHGTVSNYWKLWAKSGIVRETETKGRYQKLFDIDEFLAGGTDGGDARNGA